MVNLVIRWSLKLRLLCLTIIGASVSEPPLVDSTDALSRYIYIYIPRAHLVVQLGRAVCIYVCIYVYIYMYIYMYISGQPVRIPLISKCLYVNLF